MWLKAKADPTSRCLSPNAPPLPPLQLNVKFFADGTSEHHILMAATPFSTYYVAGPGRGEEKIILHSTLMPSAWPNSVVP